jgi:hypothetical protein
LDANKIFNKKFDYLNKNNTIALTVTAKMINCCFFVQDLFYKDYFMFTFFKDSFREIKHVVWPTKKETTNYFLIVIVILVLF